MDFLQQNQTAKVGFLSKQLNVTPETIRRDLEHLEEVGTIKRVHGGAMINQTNTPETNFLVREAINIKEKEFIALEACQYVQEGDFIALDVSTTNTEIAKQLQKNFNQLSILTNSLTIATIVSQNPNFEVILPGGRLRNSELCIVGGSAIKQINRLHIDTFFMSVSGVSLTDGLMDIGHGEYEVKMAMFNNATNTLVVADHTKFEATSMLRIGPLSSVNGIITDPMIAQAIVEHFDSNGIPLFYYQEEQVEC